MSGLAAAVRLDGGPPPHDALEALVAAAPHRRPDGCTTWSGAGAALAKLHRLSLPGQLTSAQPSAGAGLVAIFDGRLDNRREIAARFPDAALGDDDDDVRYAATALAREGAAGVERLDGDFALVVWDARARTLVAARDRMGLRPLYWTESESVLLLASDVRQLLAALRSMPPPDLTALAALIAFEPPTGARTLYAGIQRVPPGHVLIADAHGVRARAYWRAEPGAGGAARSDDDYAEECRALLDAAVGARLRAAAPPALFYSGGIDSSSVLASALRVGGAAGVSAPRPLTLVFDEPESREEVFRERCAEAFGVRSQEIRPDAFDARAYAAQAARRGVPADLPGQFLGRSLRRRAADTGARVVLTGEGGDAVFAGSTFVYADLLRAGRVFAAVRQHRLDATYDDSGWSRLGLLTDGVWPLLPYGLRRSLRRPLRRVTGRDSGVPWLRLPRVERDAVPDPPAGVPVASWAVAWELNHGWTSFFVEAFERDAAEWQLEPRHPLLAPALVRFALSLPEAQRRRGRITKFVLRRAAGLPAELGARLTKADLGFTLRQALDALGGRAFFERMRLADAGWIDAAAACRGYDVVCRAASPAEPVAGPLLARLWLLASIELWFRGAYHGAA